jgi:hypothetical protein
MMPAESMTIEQDWDRLWTRRRQRHAAYNFIVPSQTRLLELRQNIAGRLLRRSRGVGIRTFAPLSILCPGRAV